MWIYSRTPDHRLVEHQTSLQIGIDPLGGFGTAATVGWGRRESPWLVWHRHRRSLASAAGSESLVAGREICKERHLKLGENKSWPIYVSSRYLRHLEHLGSGSAVWNSDKARGDISELWTPSETSESLLPLRGSASDQSIERSIIVTLNHSEFSQQKIGRISYKMCQPRISNQNVLEMIEKAAQDSSWFRWGCWYRTRWELQPHYLIL